MGRRVRTTAPRWLRPQMATSMQQRTGTPTKTPAVVGRAQARTPIRSTTRQVTPAPPRAVQLLAATDSRKKADHRPGVAVVVAGEAGRLALAVRQAPAAGAAGEVADEERYVDGNSQDWLY